jgi:hypothetical protein
MQHRSLTRHMAEHHPEVMNFAPPSLYSPVLARTGPRHFDVTWDENDVMVECPVRLCDKHCPTQTEMRRHFCARHYDQGLSFNAETTYDKCELCMLYVEPARLAKHQEMELCHRGNVRRQTRAMIAAALLPAPTIFIGDNAVERVTKFRYLGRILSQDDHDLSACVRNLQRARVIWAAVSKVLKREGASKSFARFYPVIVSTVLLYGSDTWVVTKRMETLLTSFHNQCARHITRRYIRCIECLGFSTVGWSSGGSLAVEPSSGHVLRPRPPKWFIVTLCPPPTHLPTMPHFNSNLTSPIHFLEPTNTTSRFGSLSSLMEPGCATLIV